MDLFLTADQRFAGGGLDYSHRLTGALSAFARGWVGWQHEPGGWRTDVGGAEAEKMLTDLIGDYQLI